MRVAVISDTHNNESGILSVLGVIRGEGVDTIIHCGDMSTGYATELFKGFCIHHVWGNNDFDTLSIEFAIEECVPGSTCGEVYTSQFDGRKIAVIHGHNTRMYFSLLENGKFDYIFCGHTHRRKDQTEGLTRVINPGAIGGAFRGKRGFCIVDFSCDQVDFYDL